MLWVCCTNVGTLNIVVSFLIQYWICGFTLMLCLHVFVVDFFSFGMSFVFSPDFQHYSSGIFPFANVFYFGVTTISFVLYVFYRNGSALKCILWAFTFVLLAFSFMLSDRICKPLLGVQR